MSGHAGSVGGDAAFCWPGDTAVKGALIRGWRAAWMRALARQAAWTRTGTTACAPFPMVPLVSFKWGRPAAWTCMDACTLLLVPHVTFPQKQKSHT